MLSVIGIYQQEATAGCFLGRLGMTVDCVRMRRIPCLFFLFMAGRRNPPRGARPRLLFAVSASFGLFTNEHLVRRRGSSAVTTGSD